jgi:UDP-N-acetylmuramate dehydrogenase
MRGLIQTAAVEALRQSFPDGLQEQVSLARFTSSRIGGPADFLIMAGSAEQLVHVAQTLWKNEVPFRVLGSGSNILVADRGVRGVVVLNRARSVRLWKTDEGPRVKAESGASLMQVARRAVKRGWTGLEWATTIPGTLGGAVVGNAGAYGGDIAGNFVVAEILQPDEGLEQWSVDRLQYAYRDSWIKRHPGRVVVISATLRVEVSTPGKTNEKMRALIAQRKQTQPAGASMGSMFKNPEGDFAGRLIDEAGLKGLQCGAAQISPMHGNFFVNTGGATAADVWELIRRAREKVAEKFGLELELEIELVGDWQEADVDGQA